MGGKLMSKSGYSRVWCLRAFGLFVASIVLTACQHLGPWALEQGRTRYNEKIHLTSRDQLFANIIRVYYQENPLFMDVSEVDAAELIQGTVSGGATGIGGLSGLANDGQAVIFPNGSGLLRTEKVPSPAGAVAGSFGYQESPTIRYFPLSGQALVAQILTPISVTSIANLATSDWPFLPLLDFTLDRATPNFSDIYAAINAIVSLNDDYAALVLAATKSDATRPEAPAPQRVDGTNITVQSAPPAQQATDSLTLYLQPDHPDLTWLNVDPQSRRVAEKTQCIGPNYVQQFYNELATDDTTKLLLAKRNIMHLWIRLLKLYLGTQSDDLLKKYDNKLQKARMDLQTLDNKVGRLNASELNTELDKLPKKIELRSSAVPTKKQATPPSKRSSGSEAAANISPPNKSPVIQMHSAVGILVSSLFNYPNAPFIGFVPTPDTFKRISEYPWNDHPSAQFYTVLENDKKDILGESQQKANLGNLQECVSKWVSKNPDIRHNTFSVDVNVDNYGEVQAETSLAELRRYLLINVADSAPADAFVFYTKEGYTYYIDGGDNISKKNFALLSELMTMQAVAPTTAPLTPTISVGAGG
jgi:hypothetical protein